MQSQLNVLQKDLQKIGVVYAQGFSGNQCIRKYVILPNIDMCGALWYGGYTLSLPIKKTTWFPAV